MMLGNAMNQLCRIVNGGSNKDLSLRGFCKNKLDIFSSFQNVRLLFDYSIFQKVTKLTLVLRKIQIS